MRRGILAVVGTVAGTALMLGAKLGTAPAPDPAAALADDGGTPAAGDPSGGAAVPTPASAAPSTSGSPAPAPSTSAGAAPSPGGTRTPTPTKPASGLRDGDYTGAGTSVTRYRYTLTVSITVSGGRITAANVSCGNASGESKTICQGRSPKLVQETLAAQSAKVATVSGATYTSDAYTVSLQSAIDQAKA